MPLSTVLQISGFATVVVGVAVYAGAPILPAVLVAVGVVVLVLGLLAEWVGG